MYRTVYVIFSLIFFLFLSNNINAQLELPRISQKASVAQRIGLADVTVSYSRPNVKGRIIWGDLVPYNKVWRTGADEATTISFSEDVKLNGKKISAGKYALFTIPGKDEWTIVINSVAKQWGAFNYDSTKDVIRLKTKPVENRFLESLTFYFSDVSDSSSVINIVWEKVKVSFNVLFDTDSLVYSSIKRAFAEAKPDDWVVYAAAANYEADKNMHIDEAQSWIEKSISIKETYYNYFIKARLYEKKGKNKEALKCISKSRELGKNDKEFSTLVSQVDKLEKELKSKK